MRSVVASLAFAGVGAQPQAGAPWPMLGALSNRSGTSTTCLGPMTAFVISYSVTPSPPTPSSLNSPSAGLLGSQTTIFSVSSSGYVYGIDATGTTLAFSRLSVPLQFAPGAFGMTPALAVNNFGYFGDAYGNLCKFELVAGTTQTEAPGSCVGPSYTTAAGTVGSVSVGLAIPAGFALTSPALTTDGAVCAASVFGSVHCVSLDFSKYYDPYFVNATTTTPISPLFGVAAGTSSTQISSSVTLDAQNALYFSVGTNTTVGYIFALASYKELRATYNLRWVASLPSGVMTSPVVDSRGYLYVISTSGYAYQYSTATGAVTTWGGQVCDTPAPSASIPLSFPTPVTFSTSTESFVALSCAGKGEIPIYRSTTGSGFAWRIGTNTSATCYPTAGALYSTLSSATVYAGCTDGTLQAFDYPSFSSFYAFSGALSVASYPALLGDGSLAITTSSSNVIVYKGSSSPTALPSPSASSTATFSLSPSSSMSAGPTRTLSFTGSFSMAPTPSASASSSECASQTTSVTAGSSPTVTSTSSATAAASASLVSTATNAVPTMTESESSSASVSSAPSSSYTDSPSVSVSSSAAATLTSSTSNTASATSTLTASTTRTPTTSATPSKSPSPTPSTSFSPTPVISFVYVDVATASDTTSASLLYRVAIAMLVIGLVALAVAISFYIYRNPASLVALRNCIAGGPPPAKRAASSRSLRMASPAATADATASDDAALNVRSPDPAPYAQPPRSASVTAPSQRGVKSPAAASAFTGVAVTAAATALPAAEWDQPPLPREQTLPRQQARSASPRARQRADFEDDSSVGTAASSERPRSTAAPRTAPSAARSAATSPGGRTENLKIYEDDS